jgi:hypothetical protein
MDIDSTNKYSSLISAVSDIMMKNQNLYQQDLESQYAQYNKTPEEIQAQVAQNEIDVPDPVSDAVDVDPETIIPGSSGVTNGEEE